MWVIFYINVISNNHDPWGVHRWFLGLKQSVPLLLVIIKHID